MPEYEDDHFNLAQNLTKYGLMSDIAESVFEPDPACRIFLETIIDNLHEMHRVKCAEIRDYE